MTVVSPSIRHHIACATLSLAAAVALTSRGVVAQQPQSVEARLKDSTPTWRR